MISALKLKTYLRLGLGNLARVGLYRLMLRTGLHPVQRIRRDISGSNFFAPFEGAAKDIPVPEFWNDSGQYFGWHHKPLNDEIPSWHENPFDHSKATGKDTPWWKISDFDSPVGDIKTVWEASRLDWVLTFAQRAATGDTDSVDRLNSWLANWCEENPAFMGSNWKCGQEASIRVLHLALAARLLGQDKKPGDDLVRLMEAHVARIRPTVGYAKAQDNNHGTSEAAALFIGGTLCQAGGISQGAAWAEEGRRLLEERVGHLILLDGSFSQYSLNYHRLMLDTLSLVELWRRWGNFSDFSLQYVASAKSAAMWLHNMIEAESGDGPNLGSNDGANLLPLTDAGYRDYRPAAQLAMALFADRKAYPAEGHQAIHLQWLQVAVPAEDTPAPISMDYFAGGYSVLREGPWMAMLKYPRYLFRPHHCDALHLDLWHGSRNILSDAGTYGYNADPKWIDYFSGVSAHNTVAFDEHEQMPSVGRFLRGAWVEVDKYLFQAGVGRGTEVLATYEDWMGCRHTRQIQMIEGGITVKDEVWNFRKKAVLRWRLAPGSWTLDQGEVRGGGMVLRMGANVEIKRIEIVEGWQSLHYLKKTPLPVLELELDSPGVITTEIMGVDNGNSSR